MIKNRTDWFGIVMATDEEILYYNKMKREEILELESYRDLLSNKIKQLKLDIIPINGN